MMISTLASCADTKSGGDKADKISVKYSGPYSDTDGTYGGVDSLGRVLSLDGVAPETRDRKVGIFYFLWQGQHSNAAPVNVYELVQNNPGCYESEKAWKKAGGGDLGGWTYWSEPLFDYYMSTDEWVYRKHIQMLMDAGIDFIVFDTTNQHTYSGPVRHLIEVWYEYLEKGYNVPKIVYYTNTESGKTINQIYKEIYNNSKLHNEYPRLDELFFYYDGKPLIIGNTSDANLKDECREYFRIKESVWPNGPRTDDGFPWMEFDRLYTDEAVYGLDGRKEIVNVSIAQHCDTVWFSKTEFYGGNDHTRSWHDGANDTSEDAMYWGYNFQEQWDWAISVDPEMIFITGWNEWCAQRWNSEEDAPIMLCDNCGPNTSRDAEPMKGLFGDNYYMQMIDNIRKYKGVASRVNTGGNITIDINGSFDQWSAAAAKYTDYSDDTADRNNTGLGLVKYTDDSGRNDFVSLKAARDGSNMYFYAETASDIVGMDDGQWMTLFISSGVPGKTLWENQFDFAVNYEKPENGKAVLSAYDGSTWTRVGLCDMKVEGSKLMLSVPKSSLGIADSDTDPINVQFKWADNYSVSETGEIDIFSFYTKGDAAPIGRQTYVFSERNYLYGAEG